MKSLEILEHIKNAPSFMGGDDIYKNNIQSHWVFLEDIETIKADLEVLEIIKNNKVDVWELLHILRNWKNEPDYMIKAVYNDRCWGEQCALSDEEVIKLKQWLEENEE